MTNLSSTDIARIKNDASLTVRMQSALIAGDEAKAVQPALILMATSPEEIACEAGPDELQVRGMVHEVVSSLMTDLIFSDAHEGTFWRRLMLPTASGVLGYPIWIGNAKWIHLFGGELSYL